MSTTTTTYLVRLRPYDPRRGHVLRRYTYMGIKFDAERGWYRVTKSAADYLRGVHQEAGNEHSPLAFDVCTESEAQAIDAREHEAANPRRFATDDIKVSIPRDGAHLDSAPADRDDRAQTPAPAARDGRAQPSVSNPAPSAKPEAAPSATPETSNAASRTGSAASSTASTAAPSPRSTAPPAARDARARRAGGR